MKKTNILATLLLVSISLYGADDNPDGNGDGGNAASALAVLQNCVPALRLAKESVSDVVEAVVRSNTFQQLQAAAGAAASDVYDRFPAVENPWKIWRRRQAEEAFGRLNDDSALDLPPVNGAIEKK